ncbi:MAG: nucleotidyltransferase [Roseburia sp.]|nr:nucleotidyltransferase [Roseburia sp.]MCM1557481.1 nucleotidyltransferase [Anaeroplasma bactoclasticum]
MSNMDKYLNMIGHNLQLSDVKFEELNKNYKALSSYIANQHQLSGEEEYSIYQQGSFAIDTAIKPLKNDDFDVDVVVEFEISKDEVGPVEFYNQLLDTFKEGRYGHLVEEYRNNIRINYDNNYHFDIMPAIPLDFNSESLDVPDRKKRQWVIRSPKTYRDWFITRSKMIKGYKITIRDNKFFMESATTPLRKPLPYERKPILNRVVQLIKRARDIYFKDTDDYYPQSIVLTTLAANFYEGESSVYEALTNIVHKMKILKDEHPRFDVYNPACNGHQENFTEKWKQITIYYDNYYEFADFLEENVADLNSNALAKKALCNLFGESSVNTIQEETEQDAIWNTSSTNLHTENVFPNARIKIDKKERGNA